jgi:hypothetical protein
MRANTGASPSLTMSHHALRSQRFVERKIGAQSAPQGRTFSHVWSVAGGGLRTTTLSECDLPIIRALCEPSFQKGKRLGQGVTAK